MSSVEEYGEEDNEERSCDKEEDEPTSAKEDDKPNKDGEEVLGYNCLS